MPSLGNHNQQMLKPSSEGMSHGELIKTDKMGFRLTHLKSDTSLSDWLYLGDSVTMGIGVSTDHTFAYLADKQLKKIKIRIRSNDLYSL